MGQLPTNLRQRGNASTAGGSPGPFVRIAGPLAVFALYFQRGPQGPLILSRLGCWPRCVTAAPIPSW
jgi:hypothetical protein